MPSTFPQIAATNGTDAANALVNRFAAAGLTQPTGGLSIQDFQSLALANLLLNAYSGNATCVTNGITAHAGGGQGSATALTTPINTISTCATIGDSVVLPTSAAGAVVLVKNNGATACDIFPATGDAINALAANTAVRLNSKGAAEFFCTVAGTWHCQLPQLPPAKFTTAAYSGSTAAAGEMTGAGVVVITNTGNNPGTYTTRTAAQMFADSDNVTPGDSYILILVNGQGTGTWTLGGAAAGVTYTGTMTVAVNTWRAFVVTLTSASAVTIQNFAVGTFS